MFKFSLNTFPHFLHSQLFETDSYNIEKIAQITGFESQQYFARVFKKHTGMTPSYYRANLKRHFMPY